uniref:non-specific serine/threonine protein kinase n=1 Tax=Parascaris univalens TaxID=6257 RepID=A0A915B4N2_PARUN
IFITVTAEGLIGKGGYGQIYFAYDITSPKAICVAIKIEPKRRKGKTTRRMILEQKAIAALRDIHQLGYIHRDIKPQNMCFGLSQASKHRLIIVDYGLARRFRHSSGRLRPLREQCGFRGTTIYASLRSHDGKDLGPSDDLISLFYSAIEMVKGELPWKGLRRAEDVKLCKMAMQCDDFQVVAKNVGEQFRELGRAVTTMDVDDEPNYSALQDIMMDFTDHRKLSDPYDWDNDFQEVYQEYDLNRTQELHCDEYGDAMVA